MTGVPTLMTNPFDEAFLADLTPTTMALRDAGRGVARLDRRLWNGPYAEVSATSRSRIFLLCSRLSGLSDFAKGGTVAPAFSIAGGRPAVARSKRAPLMNRIVSLSRTQGGYGDVDHHAEALVSGWRRDAI